MDLRVVGCSSRSLGKSLTRGPKGGIIALGLSRKFQTSTNYLEQFKSLAEGAISMHVSARVLGTDQSILERVIYSGGQEIVTAKVLKPCRLPTKEKKTKRVGSI
jgi:hypothetical protein